jgi:hypothetical protein
MSAQAARHILPPRSGGMEETMMREWRIRRATEAPGSAGTGRTRTYCGGAWKPKGHPIRGEHLPRRRLQLHDPQAPGTGRLAKVELHALQ